MNITLGRTVLLVEDYDAAFDFYQTHFGCRKLHDSTGPDGRRYLHAAFPGDGHTGIWFMTAEGEAQRQYIGRQTAGQPTLVLYTDAIEPLYERLQQNGVTISEPLVTTPQSRFFHCLDLHGNRLTVVQLTEA